MNRKGFTMIELLATIVILGILMSLGIMAYTYNRDRSAKKAYKLMHSNVSSAAENYFMDNMAMDEVSLETLVSDQYLESAQDPWDKDGKCTGEVSIDSVIDEEEDALPLYNYKVQLKCSKGCTCLIYPNKSNCTCDDKYND